MSEGLDLTAAVEAGVKAMEQVTPPPRLSLSDWLATYGDRALLAGAIAAAAPLIDAQVREQVAREIEREAEVDESPPMRALWIRDSAYWDGVILGKHRAAIIARGPKL